MIRDFLDHLLLDLRISHYEKSGESNPELASQLAHYLRKYRSQVQVSTQLGAGYPSDEAKADASRFYSDRIKQTRDEQLLHLEALRSVFDEALRCASLPGELPVVQKSWRDYVTDMEADGYSLPDPADYWPPIPEGVPYPHPITDIELPEVREMVKTAEIVLGFNLAREAKGTTAVFYGNDLLKKISEQSIEPDDREIIVFALDFGTSELEYLVAATQVLKGSCCYGE